MIGKVPRPGRGFTGLVSYLMQGPKGDKARDRVAWSSVRNLALDDPEAAPRLMRALASRSTRCQRPVYHLVISWHRDENPTEALMRQVGADTLIDLDLAEHQALLLAHNDTAHKHLHIVVNRIHPGTRKAWKTSMDYARIEKSLRRQAEAMHLPYVPGRFNDPEAFAGKAKHVRDAEFQAAIRHARPVPKDRWSADEIRSRRLQLAPMFAEAQSWDQLSERLQASGLYLAAKGQGIVIADAFGHMKLSDLGKHVWLAGLEAAYRESFHAYTARWQREHAEHHARADADLAATPRTPRARPDRPHHAPVAVASPRPPTDRDPAAREGFPNSDDEEHQLREQARAARMAEREAELRRQAQSRVAAATASDDDPHATARPFKEAAPSAPTPQPARPPQPDARAQAFAEIARASDAFDIARRFHAAGLTTDASLKSAQNDLAIAQQRLDAELTLKEKLDNDLRMALTPKPPPSKTAEQDPADDAERDHEDDRER